MGRKAEPGITYYPVRCDHGHNKKIRLLIADAGLEAYWVWQQIVSFAYSKKGYYFDISDKDDLSLFASDDCKVTFEKLEQIIAVCVKRNLFDQELAENYNILTSEHIQEVYVEATSERRRKGTSIEIISEFLLINIPDTVRNIKIVSGINEIIPRNNPQSKYKVNRKESKVNDTTVSPVEILSTDQDEKLESAYKKIVKEKKQIFDFIKQHKPIFIDPYYDFWNLFAAEKKLPLITTINTFRKRHFNARIQEKAFDFSEILRKAAASERICTGGWFSFDWIIKNDENYIKVLEGNYDKSDQNKQQSGNGGENEATTRMKNLLNEQNG